MNDIDGAIAAVSEPKSVEMMQLQARVGSTGRPFSVIVPVDVTDEEALAICGYVAALPTELRRQRPASRIVLPRPM